MRKRIERIRRESRDSEPSPNSASAGGSFDAPTAEQGGQRRARVYRAADVADGVPVDLPGDVRGLGAMLAIELVRDRGTKEPAPELATRIVEAAAERGLLLLKSGIYSNCIRVLVPFVISDAELDEALGVWEDALEAMLGSTA